MISTIFFGSPQEVTPILQSLINDPKIQIICVITQPDRLVGRKKNLTPTPIKLLATSYQLPVLTPIEFNNEFYLKLKQTISKLKTKQPDLAILSAYGAIIPKQLLKLPKYGFINLHPSLLPKYRGASPTTASILNGDQITGLTFMQMDEQLDHGPIIAQFEEPIKPTDTHQTLTARLFQKGSQILPEVTKKYIDYQITKNYTLFLPPKEQNHDQATFTKILKRDDGYIPWKLIEAALNGQQQTNYLNEISPKLRSMLVNTNQSLPEFIERAIRTLAPWPGAWTKINLKTKNEQLKTSNMRIKLLSAHLEKNSKLKTKNLKLNEVRLEGKPTMTWKKFQNSYPDISHFDPEA